LRKTLFIWSPSRRSPRRQSFFRKERLKIDAAKARAVAEIERDSEAKLNQFGREIVAYEDMPELREEDQYLLALMEERIPNLLEALSSETLDMEKAFNGLSTYLLLEDEAKTEAAVLHRTTVEKLDAKNEIELAKIRKDLDTRYEAISKRNGERDNTPV